ncbi:zinc finger MYND domain-containing protein 12 isoform X1 [Octopus bimaculoides]|uniref:MYND-type domain-containing protein n=2 Tax=Octopus bimaculoides TaxID=37653 RepID=A0A0L8HAB8_OCTBM|nr:zinc finger MYND domain-containing protein 12 isoform X1 [Octopus bimaculoides]|eukprot:XP_014774051.1 PREDICTED: zinc finger MYND domain-containing protein 12-like isoform X1 [Octopus bimaculoides]
MVCSIFSVDRLKSVNMSVYPFAVPKGIKLLCELCQKSANLVCTNCKVTYYCCSGHQTSDKESVHSCICDNLAKVRQPEKYGISEEQRQKRKEEIRQLNIEIIQTATTRAHHLLFQGLHEQALPAALHSVKFCMEIYGPQSIELIPSYLCLGEACIGLGRLADAEQYLSQANWIALTNPKCPSSILYNLHRNLGLLYAAKGDYAEAARHFADDIYHASEEYGTDSLKTSGGYYHMANVFFRQSKMDIAMSLYRQVTKIWHNYLLEIASDKIKKLSSPKTLAAVNLTSEHRTGLDETDEAEGIQVLSTIFDIWESSHKKHSKDLAESSLALAMLFYCLEQYDKAKKFCNKAYQVCEDKEYTEIILKFLNSSKELSP